jgi:CRISPR-associated protein Cmr5
MPGRNPPQPPQHKPEPAATPAIRRRDQQWALHAYGVVCRIERANQKDYKIAVNDLGANILRNGLSAALATLERQKGSRGEILLEHLATAKVTGLAGATGNDLPHCVRQLKVDAYVIATREILQLAGWLKRAAQATFGED